MRALDILNSELHNEFHYIAINSSQDTTRALYLQEAIKELEELNNRSCRNCKHSIFIEAIETRWCMLLESSCTILKYCSEFKAKR